MRRVALMRGPLELDEPVVQQRNAFRPSYTFLELERYRMYFDANNRRVLW